MIIDHIFWDALYFLGLACPVRIRLGSELPALTHGASDYPRLTSTDTESRLTISESAQQSWQRMCKMHLATLLTVWRLSSLHF